MRRAQIANGVFGLQFRRLIHHPADLYNGVVIGLLDIILLTLGCNDAYAQSFVHCGKIGGDHVQKNLC